MPTCLDHLHPNLTSHRMQANRALFYACLFCAHRWYFFEERFARPDPRWWIPRPALEDSVTKVLDDCIRDLGARAISREVGKPLVGWAHGPIKGLPLVCNGEALAYRCRLRGVAASGIGHIPSLHFPLPCHLQRTRRPLLLVPIVHLSFISTSINSARRGSSHPHTQLITKRRMAAALGTILSGLVTDAPPITRFPGMNQVFGVVRPNTSSTTISFLGQQQDEASCLKACIAATARCWSLTFFATGPFSRQCFGVTSPRWSPTPDNASSSMRLLWACRTDDDCSLNGACLMNGTCACRHQWEGHRCETLSLTPAVRGAGYRGMDRGRNTSSWGGAVLRADDGKYHMWISEMTEHCGIGAWAQNSRIIRAEADEPHGPFRRQQVVWNVFAHEPMMARAPTGEYVMFFTSNRAERPHGLCNCCQANISKCDGSTGPYDCPSGSLPLRAWSGDADPTYMSFARAPHGPWSTPQAIFPDWKGSDTNFAPLILEDGSLLGLWRSWEATGSRVFLATAPDWRNVSSYVQHHDEVISVDLGTAGTEDPFLYRDDAGHFHAVFHHMFGEGTSTQWWLDTCGGHAFSRDGLTWEYSGVAWGNAEHPHGNAVHFTDGSKFSFTRRERPHLIFGSDGAPSLLTSAAQYGPGKLPGALGDNGDASYTMVQPIQNE